MKILTFFRKIINPIFGEFEQEEFKKFLRMGFVFAFIIGSHWTLGPLKNAIFCTLVNATQLPWVKASSMIFLVPLLMFYTKLLDMYKREKVFYIISSIYCILSLLFTGLIAYTQQSTICTIDQHQSWLQYIIGYAFYLFVESYGSLVPALFWAIASDTTTPDSAKKGYSFVMAFGQLGGIFGPYLISSLPRRLGFATNAFSIFICALTILISILLFRNFFKKTPENLLQSYHGENEKDKKKEQETGFFEGLKLMIRHKYLLGILAVVAFPEIIITIVDLHFNSLASESYSGIHLAEYLGAYGSSVNAFAFLFLILGIGNITRILSIGVSLVLMPIIYGWAILGFISLNSLSFLFLLMAFSKAINYSLNGPAIKQLYIPTTHDVRFKSQGWIESLKGSGVLFNMLLGPMQSKFGIVLGRARHAVLSSYLSFFLIFIWIFIALFLGKKYKKAIDEKRVVC